MNTQENVLAAIGLDAETIRAGSRVTALRASVARTRSGSKRRAELADALAQAKADHARLQRQRDAAWAQASARR